MAGASRVSCESISSAKLYKKIAPPKRSAKTKRITPKLSQKCTKSKPSAPKLSVYFVLRALLKSLGDRVYLFWYSLKTIALLASDAY